MRYVNGASDWMIRENLADVLRLLPELIPFQFTQAEPLAANMGQSYDCPYGVPAWFEAFAIYEPHPLRTAEHPGSKPYCLTKASCGICCITRDSIHSPCEAAWTDDSLIARSCLMLIT